MTDLAVAEERSGAAPERRVRLLSALAAAFAAETDRHILWLPVFFATGIAVYFGAMRIAPSRRMVSPFSIWFSTMCRASAAYSDGSPRRDG